MKKITSFSLITALIAVSVAFASANTPKAIGTCLTCHQSNLMGLPGVFPKLVGDSPTLRDPHAIALIILFGSKGKGAPCPTSYQLSDSDVIELSEYLARLNGVDESVTRSDIKSMRTHRKKIGQLTSEEAMRIAQEYSSKEKTVSPEIPNRSELDEIDKKQKEELIRNRPGEGSALLDPDGTVEVIIWPKTLQDDGRRIIIRKDHEHYDKILNTLGPFDDSGLMILKKIPGIVDELQL